MQRAADGRGEQRLATILTSNLFVDDLLASAAVDHEGPGHILRHHERLQRRAETVDSGFIFAVGYCFRVSPLSICLV